MPRLVRPWGGVNFGPFLEEFEDNGGAAQRQEKTHKYGFAKGSAEMPGQGQAGQAGDRHLDGTGHQNRLPDLQKVGEGKFHPDGEE